MAIIKASVIIDIYETESGKSPFHVWLAKLDVHIKIIIEARFARIRCGNFGDCEPIAKSGGLWEVKIHEAAGYRIYFKRINEALIMVLCAGKKDSQYTDIQKAKLYWQDVEQRGGYYGYQKKEWRWCDKL